MLPVPVDMKEMIARATMDLLLEKKVRKLTVKDIVEACHITRQTFYYHFEDIPDLMRWVLERSQEQILKEVLSREDWESGLFCLFSFAVSARPLAESGLRTNYREELEKCFSRWIYSFFEQVILLRGIGEDCSRADLDFALRYHSQAVMGLFKTWTEADTRDMERIVHRVYQMMTGGIASIFKERDE